MIVRVTFADRIDSMPKSCSECKFSDLCDGRVAKLTIKDGIQWSKAATQRVSHNCPMEIVDE